MLLATFVVLWMPAQADASTITSGFSYFIVFSLCAG
jgi:hypothetical protein